MQTEDPRSAILNLLKRRDSSVDELSPELGISPTATRQHLAILERDGLIKRTSVKEKLGRPKVIYSLSEKAERSFPKAYADFFKWTIKDLIEREGPERVRSLMERLGTQQASYYRERVREDGDVESVVEILNELGAFAEMKRENGHILIREYNCLIYDIAMEFGDLVCEFDLKFISSLLNSNVALKSCIARGDRYCSFALDLQSALDSTEAEE
jgi:DeoR family suf operon transcriptional repressor